MTEFSKHMKTIGLTEEAQKKIEQLINEAASEFPCLSCPSKDECGSFTWFQKWFGTPK